MDELRVAVHSTSGTETLAAYRSRLETARRAISETWRSPQEHRSAASAGRSSYRFALRRFLFWSHGWSTHGYTDAFERIPG